MIILTGGQDPFVRDEGSGALVVEELLVHQKEGHVGELTDLFGQGIKRFKHLQNVLHYLNKTFVLNLCKLRQNVFNSYFGGLTVDDAAVGAAEMGGHRHGLGGLRAGL